MKIIDVHTHGLNGLDSRSSDVRHITTIAQLHGQQGVSEIILSIYPATIKIMRENLSIIKKAMEAQVEVINISKSVVTNGQIEFPPFNHALIRGAHLEGPFLNPEFCGALNAASFLKPTEQNLESLIEGYSDIIKIITVAPELDGAVNLIKKISDMGIIVNMGHSKATYAEAEAGFKAGSKCVTHLFNAMSPFTHRQPGLAGFALTNKDIYVEVIADPFHLHHSTIDLIFGMKRSDRVIVISDSVKETILSTNNKSPLQVSNKLVGGAMTITESANRLVQIGYPPETILKYISTNPSTFLKVN
jgi:N-acetylglucosamine-6-phosphate deacetylase